MDDEMKLSKGLWTQISAEDWCNSGFIKNRGEYEISSDFLKTVDNKHNYTYPTSQES